MTSCATCFLEGQAYQNVKSILLTGSEVRILAFHCCQAVTLVKIDFISSWISAGKLRAFDAHQISANKILLLPVTGSIALPGHHFMHLQDIIWFQHVLKSFRLAHFCAVHFIHVQIWESLCAWDISMLFP